MIFSFLFWRQFYIILILFSDSVISMQNQYMGLWYKSSRDLASLSTGLVICFYTVARYLPPFFRWAVDFWVVLVKEVLLCSFLLKCIVFVLYGIMLVFLLNIESISVPYHMDDHLKQKLEPSNLHFPAWLYLNLDLTMWTCRSCVRKPTGISVLLGTCRHSWRSFMCVLEALKANCSQPVDSVICRRRRKGLRLALDYLFQYIKWSVGIAISRVLDETQTFKSASKMIFGLVIIINVYNSLPVSYLKDTYQLLQNSSIITCITQRGTN